MAESQVKGPLTRPAAILNADSPGDEDGSSGNRKFTSKKLTPREIKELTTAEPTFFQVDQPEYVLKYLIFTE